MPICSLSLSEPSTYGKIAIVGALVTVAVATTLFFTIDLGTLPTALIGGAGGGSLLVIGTLLHCFRSRKKALREHARPVSEQIIYEKPFRGQGPDTRATGASRNSTQHTQPPPYIRSQHAPSDYRPPDQPRTYPVEAYRDGSVTYFELNHQRVQIWQDTYGWHYFDTKRQRVNVQLISLTPREQQPRVTVRHDQQRGYRGEQPYNNRRIPQNQGVPPAHSLPSSRYHTATPQTTHSRHDDTRESSENRSAQKASTQSIGQSQATPSAYPPPTFYIDKRGSLERPYRELENRGRKPVIICESQLKYKKTHPRDLAVIEKMVPNLNPSYKKNHRLMLGLDPENRIEDQKRLSRNQRYLDDLKQVIRQQLKEAVRGGYRDLVYHPTGCGPFCNPPKIVAETIKEVLDSQEFAGKFDSIYFAIGGLEIADEDILFKQIEESKSKKRESVDDDESDDDEPETYLGNFVENFEIKHTFDIQT